MGALVLAVVVAAGLLITTLSGSGFCGDRREVTVAAEPDIAEHVEGLAESARGCDAYAVEAVSSADIAARVASREALPEIWIPDSAIRLAQVSQDVQIPFDTVMNSIASTPVILASRDTDVDLSTWTAALATPGLLMGDPVRSGIADAPILSATSEVENMRSTPEALDTALAALAQSQTGRMQVAPAAGQMLETVIAEGGAAIVSEHQALSRPGHADDPVELTAPETGAVFLTYPLAVSTQEPTRREEVTAAAEALRDATASDEFAAGLSEDGFRSADRAPLSDDAGVGETEVLVVRDPTRVHGTLQRWRLLSMPARSLVLVDTSGSMNFEMASTDRTRIQALVETATAGLGQFPDDAELGLWAFGGAAGRDGLPYAEVATLDRLDSDAEQGTHREALLGALAGLPGLVGGGTDLYRSVLDAYGMVSSGYDPNMINSIIVISDGANDTASDLTREDFLGELQSMVDPARPVIVVTIGLLDDADPETLAEISQTTGGSSYIATSPDEIVGVFAEAIGRRGAD